MDDGSSGKGDIYSNEAQITVLALVVLKISAIILGIQQLLKSLSIKIMFTSYGKMPLREMETYISRRV